MREVPGVNSRTEEEKEAEVMDSRNLNVIDVAGRAESFVVSICSDFCGFSAASPTMRLAVSKLALAFRIEEMLSYEWQSYTRRLRRNVYGRCDSAGATADERSDMPISLVRRSRGKATDY